MLRPAPRFPREISRLQRADRAGEQSAPDAQRLMRTLNDRATELKVTVNRLNDLMDDQNRRFSSRWPTFGA